MPSILEASKVCKSFGSVKALDSVSFSISEGEIFGLLGPNGSGKSTLIKILSGIQGLDSGKITVLGQELNSNCKKTISVIPQDYCFFEDFTVMQNIKFFGSQIGLNGKELDEKANHLLDWLELKKFSSQKAVFLSGGYKRLLNISISLLSSPKALLMDEPTVGLDPQMRSKVWAKIMELKMQGMTILLTTHYMDEAQALCDTVCMLNKGKVLCAGPPQKMIEAFGGLSIIVFVVNKEIPKELFEELKKKVKVGELSFNANSMVLSVPVKNAFKTAEAIADFLSENGFEIIKQNIKEPNLEHAFIALTGEELSQ